MTALRRTLVAALTISLVTITTTTPSQARSEIAPGESTVSLVVRARGDTGEERMQLRLDDELIDEWTVGTEWSDHAADVPGTTSIESVAVGFVNNLHEPRDRNLYVDHVRLGEVTHEVEEPTVYSTGHWAPTTGCTSGYGSSQALRCAGFLHFGGQPTDGSTIRVFAVGSTGTENLEVVIGGTSRATERVRRVGSVWSASSPVAEIVYRHSRTVTVDELRIAFVNDGADNGIDRNVRIDRIEIDGRTFDSEDPLTESSGAWSNGARCRQGFFRVEALACDGWFQYASGQSPQDRGSDVVVWARGSTGSERIEVQIDGAPVAGFRLSTGTAPYRYTHGQELTPGRVRVAFVNDGHQDGRDRNVWIDRIEIDGSRHESEHPSVLSKGAWANGARCRQGTFNTEFLACNGWFQYADNDVAPLDEPMEAPPVAVTVVADGLTNPWGLGFLPSGDLLFTERLGRLRLLATDGTLTTVAADFNNLGPGTSGLLGLVVDPDFATNRRFYTCQGQASPGRIQIVAWRLAADGGSATKVQTLLSEERQAGHSGCRLRIDDHGWLWATMGDDFVAGHPQDPTVVHGKILRLDRSDGGGAPGNPDLGPSSDRRIFSLGHRNPQGIAFEPATGEAWIVDHGPDTDDEINLLSAGGNYGWDPAGPPGPQGKPIYDELNRPMTDPAIGGAIPARWASGSPTLAPGGIAILDGEGWGEFEGAVAVTTLKDAKLRLFRFDGERNYVGQAIVPELDGRFGRLRSVILGPDGALYITTSNSGHGDNDARLDRILRVDPGTDTAPDSSTLTVRARGALGSELLQLEIDGRTVATFPLSPIYGSHLYTHDRAVSGGQVRVSFVNDFVGGGLDRNVWVDWIEIDGERFESEDPSVSSRGAWANGARCHQGVFRTEFLACNGWFQYSDGGGR